MIQCDSGHLNGDLIACARNRIYDLRANGDADQITHVLFIIHLPRQVSSSLVGFQGDPWISAHIDDLNPSTNNRITPYEAIGIPISTLFIGGTSASSIDEMSFQNESKVNQKESFTHLESEIHSEEMKNPASELPAVEVSMEDMELDDYDKEHVATEYPINMSTLADRQSKICTAEPIETNDMEFLPPQQLSPPEECSQVLPVVDETKQCSSYPYSFSPKENQVHTRRPLFGRLYSCILPAASKLKDFHTKRCTKRVQLLVHLLPKDMPHALGMHIFY